MRNPKDKITHFLNQITIKKKKKKIQLQLPERTNAPK